MTASSTSHTLSVASVNLILFAAQQRGVDPDVMARIVGIDPAQLRDPDGRVAVRQVQALWREIAAATGDPDIALKLGEMINPVAVGVLAYVMMHCPTLGQAFDKLCHYQDIVCDAVRTVGHQEGDQFRLSLLLASTDIIYPEYALNSELSMYLAAIRSLTGQPVVAREVRFAYPRPLNSREHERVFGPARLVFDTTETAMLFDTSLLALPVLNANPALFPVMAHHADELLRKLHNPSARQASLSSRVKQEIITLLKGEEPTLALVADRLAMGVRTMQLHLKDERVTYQQLLDDVRQELAIRHLREHHLSTTDVAYLLGYSEPSVFFRSFKKWTGQTPGAYRLASVA